MRRFVIDGVTIPMDIFLDEGLTPLDKIIAGLIIYHTDEVYSALENREIAELCGCSERTVSTSVSHLVKRGYFTVAKFDGRTRILKYNINV